MVILTIISLFIAAGLAVLAFVQHQRLIKYQDFEYAIRLQLQDENISFSSIASQSAFRYTSKIVNSGTKTTEIDNVYIDYGSDDDPEKRFKHIVEGKFYLRPDDHREIEFNLTHSELEDTMQKFELRQCLFSLRVVYHEVTGKITQSARHLGNFGGEGIIFVAHHSSVLV